MDVWGMDGVACMCSSIIRSSFTLSLWAIGLSREQLSLTFAKMLGYPIYTVHSNRENSLISIALHRDVYFTRILAIYRYRYAGIPYGTQIVMKQVLVTLRDSVKRFIAPSFPSSKPRCRRGQRRTHCVSI